MNMAKKIITLTILASATTLSACGSTSIFNRDRPDEFAVSRSAPLVVPPDFALTPPQPGAARPQDAGNNEQVLEALFGGAAPRSTSERAVILQAGDSDAAIRSQIGDPETETVNKAEVTRDIIAAPEGDGQNAQAAIPKG
ncbi:hypothetical protein LPB140_01915 [Sphingorhabdus lutea]|uniref:DUF3035 domain-containing protein n=1 Tax=Sphingorhabdus lutea TaxID=1913578 RepID=A0A1L3J9K5_9SPHN|nr:DUF3035 domain-containing protein [Sphingorhabdus lutea]APG61791.1 hypothetical protein LPB140_01915 [Sphingorhabdus lutea]